MLHLTADGLPSAAFAELHCRIMIPWGHMRRRQFMGLTGGAVAVGPRAVLEAPLPDGAAGNSVQKEEQDFPLIIANMPSTGQQGRWPSASPSSWSSRRRLSLRSLASSWAGLMPS